MEGAVSLPLPKQALANQSLAHALTTRVYVSICKAGRHGYDPFFIRFNSVTESFDSTQPMAHNGFTIIDSMNSRLKMDL